MTAQFLEFIRDEIRVATADHQRTTKGQLEAFSDQPQTETKRHRRKHRTELDGNGKKVKIPGDPVPGIETRTRVRPMPPIAPKLFTTASWRRALAHMDAPAGPWLRYAYADDLDYSGQQLLMFWTWTMFKDWLGDRRVAKKVMARFKMLSWLAVQDVKREKNGYPVYGPTQLAALVGANVKGWHATYANAWSAMRDLLVVLDRQALYEIARQRSHDRADNKLS